ncbi:nitrate- and nitrite sensing domain-containing protein [Streptomyces sp. NPDC002004]
MQGRFKRDGSAAAEPEPHGGTDRGSSPQHAQNPGPVTSNDSGDRGSRPGRSGGALPVASTSSPAPKPKESKESVGNGSRIHLRNWRISTRLVSLLALPVVAATSLGALRINDSMNEIQQLDNMKLLTDMTKQATQLAAALQDERDSSAGPLANGAKPSDFDVTGARDKTDRALQSFREGTQEIDNAGSDSGLLGVRSNVVQITGQLAEIKSIRERAYQDPNSSLQTVDAYSQLITQLLGLSADMAQATSSPEMIQRTRALAAFSSAKEYASVQRAVIAAALPPNNTDPGKLSETDRRYALSAYNKEQADLNVFKNIYAGNSDDLLKPIDDGNATIKESDTYAQRVLKQEDGLKLQSQRGKRSYRDWMDADSTKIQAMGKIELTLLNEMEQKARELRNSSERDAIINGALILIVLGVSLVGAFVVARSMIRSLRRLQDTATKVAQDRLPELVKQLSESDPQDVDTSVESVGVHSRDEIGQVAAAFDDVHREAVRLAAEQALLRGNVNAMFTNLSRRSQGLIQRQLSLISELESREADPDQLSSLFKLDHLATRMRRNGENLLVLAGEEPGRRWTRPVPLVDVLRAAASEVEQYERIELAAVPSTEVAGRVVNDLVHLLAELLENATSFSSPQTKVKVTGHALPDGRVLIEIHDTGIGLSPEDLAAINERLASPPTVDVSVSRRMGLFVVGRLSQRHGIRIQLRPSDSGGTTALVMLPVDVAQGGRKPGKPGAGGPPSSGGPAAAQAAAGAAAARRAAGTGAPSAGAGLLGSTPSRQVPGTGSRAALPGRDGGPQRPAPQGGAPRGPQDRPGFGGGQDSFGGPQQGRQGAAAAFGQGPASQQNRQGGFGDGPAAGRGQVPQPRANDAGDQGGRRPQLPPRGGARAELPGGNQQPRTPSWGNDTAQPPVPRASLDAPRGHEEPDSTAQIPRVDDRHGPGSTAEFARPDYNAPRPTNNAQQGTGQFVRGDVYGGQDPASTGQYPVPRQDSSTSGQYPAPRQDSSTSGQYPAPRQDSSTSGQYPAPRQDSSTSGQYPAPGYGERQQGRQDMGSTGQFERPGPAGGRPRDTAPQRPDRGAPQQPARTEPEALPPASGPGDGRTPLYDTLETNWFNQQQSGGPAPEPERRPQGPAAASRPSPASPTAVPDGQNGQNPASWRSSPNDELVRQAERVRQPSAGGVTTSGLPRRVPRANLVAGTAQQQSNQAGPQVSRAPDEVRGRLTNLRRGIQQGRQAGTGQTGSYPRPTHQQER